MKHKGREFVIPALLMPAFICAVLLLEIYLESVCANYGRLTYHYLPLYGTRTAFCLVWAIGARAVIAIRRKKDCKGKIGVSYIAVVSALIFIAIGVIDQIFLTKKLIWNQAYDVMLLLSIMCCVMRKT